MEEKDKKGYKVMDAETPGTDAMAPAGFSALGAIVKAEVDMQIATAKAYPRSIKRFRDEAMEMATLTEKIAEECMYALPRRERDKETGQMVKKTIEGPSARLGEIILSAWGNCRAGARPVGEDNEFVTCQGFFFDVERNVAVQREVKRRITTSEGRRYSADMVVVTTNAGCSIAQRNAVLAGIPKAFWSDIYDAARKTAIGDVKTLANKRSEMVAYFGKMGVTPDMILSTIGVVGIEDIGLDELAELKGIATALKEGDTTVEQAFPKPEKETEKKKGTEGVKEKIKETKEEKQEPAKEPQETGKAEAAKEEAKAEPPAQSTGGEGGGPPKGISDMEKKTIEAMDKAKGNKQLDEAWTKNVPADLKAKDRESYNRLADHYNARLRSFRP